MDRAGDGQPAFSWARPAATDTSPAGGVRGWLRQRLRDVSWFDLAVAIAITAIFDLVVGLVISAYFASHCQDGCTLHQQAHQDRMLLLLIPTVLCPPPVLVALLIKRLRVLVAGVQLVIGLALVTHAAFDLRTVNSHINGTVPCWSKLYSPKDCPWGPV